MRYRRDACISYLREIGAAGPAAAGRKMTRVRGHTGLPPQRTATDKSDLLLGVAPPTTQASATARNTRELQLRLQRTGGRESAEDREERRERQRQRHRDKAEAVRLAHEERRRARVAPSGPPPPVEHGSAADAGSSEHRRRTRRPQAPPRPATSRADAVYGGGKGTTGSPQSRRRPATSVGPRPPGSSAGPRGQPHPPRPGSSLPSASRRPQQQPQSQQSQQNRRRRPTTASAAMPAAALPRTREDDMLDNVLRGSAPRRDDATAAISLPPVGTEEFRQTIERLRAGRL
jgi:hypothetical protein